MAKVLWIDGKKGDAVDVDEAIRALRKSGEHRVTNKAISSADELSAERAAGIDHDLMVVSNAAGLAEQDSAKLNAFLAASQKPTMVFDGNSVALQQVLQQNPNVQHVHAETVMPDEWPAKVYQATVTRHTPPRSEEPQQVS